MKNFIYNTPTKVYFGVGEENNIAKYIKEYHPHKVLIHYGMHSVIKSGLLDKVKSLLDEEGISYCLLGGVRSNPTLDLVKEGIALCQKEGVGFLLAIGGGSVIDSLKDIANGLANPNDDVWDYSLGVKKPLKTTQKAAILTISAAGSEMSDSCVISRDDTLDKRGYCSENNRLDFVIENPELTYTVSKYQTACGAVDIAMHTIERYFCLGTDTDVTDAIALSIIKEAFKSGKDSYDNPTSYPARANMMWASSLAHNGLTGCGREFMMVVHQLEHEVSALYPSVAHGAGLASLWCSWARYVYKSNLDRWAKYVSFVWDIDLNKYSIEEAINLGIDKQEEYYRSIGMPTSLKELDVKEKDLPLLADKCSRGKSRILSGYMPLNYDDILAIYKKAY